MTQLGSPPAPADDRTVPAVVLGVPTSPSVAPASLAVERADSLLRRTLGLMGRRGLPEATGLLIEPCGSVHTSFMRFPIDVVYLDRERRVVKVVEALKPWRLSAGGWRAKSTLELAAGEAARLGLAPGARLRIDA